ncbi:putative lipoprotein, partial [Acinetobacter baumannii 855125]
MKNLIKGIALTTFAVLLAACSKPDISGVWIPEKV